MTTLTKPSEDAMDCPHEQSATAVRSVFLSDAHLGSPYSQADALLAFLNSIEPKYLYLVGDIVDGWRLKQRWYWRPTFSRILSRLVVLGQSGTQIRFTPGNHDAFLRDFAHDYGFVNVSDCFVHNSADGRRFLVLHGDQFDDFERRAPWLCCAGSLAYDALIWLNCQINRGRRALRLPPTYFCASVKRSAKQVATFVSDYQHRLSRHAIDNQCDGVICGHIHTPALIENNDFCYINTGDWVEDRSAILEYDDGRMALVHMSEAVEEWSTVRSANRAVGQLAIAD